MLRKYLNLPVSFTRRFTQRSVNEIPTANIIQQKIVLRDIEQTKNWKSLRDELLETSKPWSGINPKNIDSATIKTCITMKKYDLAIDYFSFLEKEQIQLNLATMSNFLKIFFYKYWAGNQKFSGQDEKLILETYKKIRKLYSLLDPLTLENLILGLSITKSWKICLELINEIKLSSTVSYLAYSAVAAAAFLNSEDKLGWDILEEISRIDRSPHEVVYLAYFNRNNVSCNEMYNYLQKNNFKINLTAAVQIPEYLKRNKIKSQISSVNNRGVCSSCGNSLKLLQITDEEFEKLKKKVFEQVIIGRDIFTKTTPQEVADFKKFLHNMPHFDVVVDGLNVAYSKGNKRSPQIYSFLVRSVVEHFIRQNEKVLILGRKHMERWPRENWSFVTRNAGTFLTQDLSQDDPYLLYCALNCGKTTKIVTRDLMRTHKFKLGDSHLKGVFSRWLTQNQWQLITVNQNGKVILQAPLPYSLVTQNVNGFWHIPIDEGNETVNQWLCIN